MCWYPRRLSLYLHTDLSSLQHRSRRAGAVAAEAAPLTKPLAGQPMASPRVQVTPLDGMHLSILCL